MRFRLPLLSLVTGRRMSADFVVMEGLALIPALGFLVVWGMTFLPVEGWVARAAGSVITMPLIAAYCAELRRRGF